MIKADSINDSALRKYVREFSAGEYLFKQGDTGDAMYVLLEGFIWILLKTNQIEHLVGICGPGEILGEKAILSPGGYRRHFTGQAKTNCTLLELDLKNYQKFFGKNPDFGLKIIRVLSERLDKANELVSLLQLDDPYTRLIQYLIYFATHHGGKDKSEIPLKVDEIYYAANLDKQIVEEAVEFLSAHGILTPTPHGFLLAEKDQLLPMLAPLKEHQSKRKKAA